MNGLTLGRYYPVDSVIHRFDPRAKIIAMILLLVAVFYPAGFYSYGVIGLLLVIGIIASKIPLSYFVFGFKPLLIMLIFLLVLNVFFIQTGTMLFEWGWFKLYSGSLIQTLYIVFRLMLMISITTMLTAATKPLDLTLGIEDLLKPFKMIGLPTHEISMMISIALRFIPTILEEAMRIMKAQQSRGVDMEEGKLKEKIQAILSLIIPLFICAFQRAEELANAMEARGYNPQGKRTRFHQLRFRFIDAFVIIVCIVVVAGVLTIGVII